MTNSDPITVAHVLNLSVQRQGNWPWRDAHVRLTCHCGMEQNLAQANVKTPEDPRRITDYHCISCGQRIAGVTHWGVEEQPLPNSMYRLGDFAIDTPIDLYLYSGPGKPDICFPAEPKTN